MNPFEPPQEPDMTALWMMFQVAENDPDMLYPFCIACLIAAGLMGSMMYAGMKLEPILIREKGKAEQWWAHHERQKRLKRHLDHMCKDHRVAAMRGGLQMVASETQEGGLTVVSPVEKGDLSPRGEE